MARRAHRSSILSSSRTPDQLRVPRSEHLVHFSRRRCFEHNQRPEHLTCRRPRLDVARRAHPWPGTWCTYRRSQYERYSLAVTSDGKVGPSGVVLRPPHMVLKPPLLVVEPHWSASSELSRDGLRPRWPAGRLQCSTYGPWLPNDARFGRTWSVWSVSWLQAF